jgi:hypothetical protein
LGVFPPPQLSGAEQPPQSRLPPQPSGTTPHSAPRPEQVALVHPQEFSIPPPPQVSGRVQDPQCSTSLQPSATTPHGVPSPSHVAGVQLSVPQRYGPPPPQVSPCGQSPQFKTSPQPSGTVPQVAASCSQVSLQPPSVVVEPASVVVGLPFSSSRELESEHAVKPPSNMRAAAK